MSKPDYTEFDAELLAHIKSGNKRAQLLKMAEPFCTKDTPDWRILDRRLQALRKKGVIRHSTARGWEIVEGGAQ